MLFNDIKITKYFIKKQLRTATYENIPRGSMIIMNELSYYNGHGVMTYPVFKLPNSKIMTTKDIECVGSFTMNNNREILSINSNLNGITLEDLYPAQSFEYYKNFKIVKMVYEDVIADVKSISVEDIERYITVSNAIGFITRRKILNNI